MSQVHLKLPVRVDVGFNHKSHFAGSDTRKRKPAQLKKAVCTCFPGLTRNPPPPHLQSTLDKLPSTGPHRGHIHWMTLRLQQR